MLSNLQKSHLAQLAARAFRIRPRQVVSAIAESKEAQDEWRRAQVAQACGKFGLRCCDQMDYKLVEAHFLHLLGEDDRAFAALQRAATEPIRQAQVKLMQVMEQYGFKHAYAEAICRRQNKCSVSEASAPQLWRLKFTIENRGKAKLGLPVPPRRHKPHRNPQPAQYANN